MPAYAVSIANILNGVSDANTFASAGGVNIRFVAPEAVVLIVDDITTNLKVAEGLMLPYEMQIDLCKSGVEAIKAVQNKRYDLVLMDHMMPKMNGLEATERIRALGESDPFFAALPIIALTANAVVGTKEMYLRSGFDDYLSKPIDMSKLAVVLEKWIPRAKRRRPEGAAAAETPRGEGIFADIPGLNAAQGLTLTGGSEKNYRNTLALFAMDAGEKAVQIAKCLEEDDIPLFTTHVHALKSACGSIGAGELSSSAGSLEIAGNIKDLSYIHLHTPRFLEELEALASGVTAALADDFDAMTGADEQVLTTTLAKLKDALNDFELQAIDTLSDTLRDFTSSADYGQALLTIQQNILIGEYDDAVAIIDGLLGKHANA
jgi:CheY-like chemotaxis protein